MPGKGRYLVVLVCTIGDCPYMTIPTTYKAAQKEMKAHQDSTPHRDFTGVPLPF